MSDLPGKANERCLSLPGETSWGHCSLMSAYVVTGKQLPHTGALEAWKSSCGIGGSLWAILGQAHNWSQWRFCLRNICNRLLGENNPSSPGQGCSEQGCGCELPVVLGLTAQLFVWLLSWSRWLPSCLLLRRPLFSSLPTGQHRQNCPSEVVPWALYPRELPF